MAVYRYLAIALVFVIALGAEPSGVSADQRKNSGKSGALEHASISGNAFQGAQGSIKVNETAGNGNAQSNIMVVSTRPTLIVLNQSATIGAKETGSVALSGNAFAGAFGAIQLNQSAGAGNAQGNIIALQFGGNAVLSDSALSQNVSSNPNFRRNSTPGGSTVCASPGAFSQSGGVVQINQTAGSSNHTVNSFQLQLPAGP